MLISGIGLFLFGAATGRKSIYFLKEPVL